MSILRSSRVAAVLAVTTAALVSTVGCNKKSEMNEASTPETSFHHIPADSLRMEISRFAPVEITYDATILSAPEKQALARLVDAARIMDEIFLRQVWAGNIAMRDELRDAAAKAGSDQSLASDMYHFFRINAGPWIRLEHDRPAIGKMAKPAGAGYYPEDVTKEEFEAYVAAHPDQKDALTGYFTRIERADDGGLKAVPYSEAYGPLLDDATRLLNEAADILTDEASRAQFAKGVDYTTLAAFLRSRAAAFQSNDYFQSDMDWMDVSDNILDVTIGPYEVYEDNLFNYKAAFEAIIAMRNPADSKRLGELKNFLPAMERNLPIPNEMKNMNRGTDSPISVVDVIYAGGDIKAGVHAIAYNLPNDERVREAKGSKKVMLKNISRAKYDKILVPIANIVLDPSHMELVNFDTYFYFSVLHELAHGLGPGTITLADGTRTTVNQVLQTLYSPLEECKADVMGMYNAAFLVEKGNMTQEDLNRMYVTFLPGLFRAVRFGLHEAHGKGNMIQYNWFKDQGAIVHNPETDRYTVVLDKMPEAAKSLTRELCLLQARGDYAAAEAFLDQWGAVPPEVERIVGRLSSIPSDVEPLYDKAH
ncbi:MAG TPA: peptidase [Candidatus Krumholzibacteria bacterium]|nr:peptidase [Candidatus Krumholzibacteria bacterium]